MAPITHHWLDSTHITNGVATGGASWSNLQAEVSGFTGRESDHRRWDLERPRFDSYSARLTAAPHEDVALQASYGHIVSPEGLAPDGDVDRLTASISWNFRPLGRLAQATFDWGRNSGHAHGAGGHDHDLDAFLLEASWRVSRGLAVFGRAERAEKDELFFARDPLCGRVFTVNALSIGAAQDLAAWKRASLAVAGSLTFNVLPSELRPAYGRLPVGAMAWLRLKLI